MAFIHCPKCNAEIAELTKVCPACHAVIEANSSILSSAAAQPPLPPNPFFTNFFGILAEPRVVFGAILQRDNGTYTWPMLWTSAIIGALADFAKGDGLVTSLVAIPLVAGIGWLFLWVTAWLNYHVGRWFGGKGSLADLYDYGVWGGAEVACFNNAAKFFRHLLPAGGAWESIWRVVGWGIDLWGIVFAILLLSVAHRYSWVRAIGTSLFITALFLIPLTLLMWHLGISWMSALMQ